MEKTSSSHETSWADQWDANPEPAYNTKKSGGGAANCGGAAAKYKQKVGEGLVKTKSVASTGVKKVKEGSSIGLQWIKDKYHKTTQKH